jgi:plastocyanin
MTARVTRQGTSRKRVAEAAAAAVWFLAIVSWATIPSGRDAAAGAVPPVRIEMKNFAFDPPAIEVKAGETLMWTNGDVVPHTATAATKAWDSGQMAPGRSYTVTLTKPGTYDYACSIHPFMHAKVVVTK